MKNIFILVVFVMFFAGYAVPNEVNAVVKFRRPVTTTMSPMFSAWYDHNSTSGVTKDYACKANTPYDAHKGTDFRSTTGTSIYAGAKGGLYYRYDSCYTTGSPGCGGGFGNHARIDHEGTTDGVSGMVSIYAHMKKGSVALPASVICGKKIGEAGSSGDSDAPHVHFELRPNGFGSAARIDPFPGLCSQDTSYWSTIADRSSGIPGTTCQ